MLLKVGELAKRSGLTVRTLHHYDAIGLLTPSARADNGYRLYDRRDVAQLHLILALRGFGLSLTEIGAYFDQPDIPLTSIVERQIATLDLQIEQASQLRDHLERLRGTLLDGAQPELADWLTTLELMTMYEKYFSRDELARLPVYRNNQAIEAEWMDLVGQVRALMESGTPPEEERPRELAIRWMTMLVRDTNGDPRLAAKLNFMHDKEPSLQAHLGISTALRDYVLRAFSETKMLIYEKYLLPDEIRFMRELRQASAGVAPVDGRRSRCDRCQRPGRTPGPPARTADAAWRFPGYVGACSSMSQSNHCQRQHVPDGGSLDAQQALFNGHLRTEVAEQSLLPLSDKRNHCGMILQIINTRHHFLCLPMASGRSIPRGEPFSRESLPQNPFHWEQTLHAPSHWNQARALTKPWRKFAQDVDGICDLTGVARG